MQYLAGCLACHVDVTWLLWCYVGLPHCAMSWAGVVRLAFSSHTHLVILAYFTVVPAKSDS